jgi:hypothetical protein
VSPKQAPGNWALPLGGSPSWKVPFSLSIETSTETAPLVAHVRVI